MAGCAVAGPAVHGNDWELVEVLGAPGAVILAST